MYGCDESRIKRLRLESGVIVVRVAGELDLCSSQTFREHLGRAASGGAPLVIDLSELSFIESTGLGVLVGVARKKAADAEGLAIVCPEGRVRRTLAVTGLDRVISVFATREEDLGGERVT